MKLELKVEENQFGKFRLFHFWENEIIHLLKLKQIIQFQEKIYFIYIF